MVSYKDLFGELNQTKNSGTLFLKIIQFTKQAHDKFCLSRCRVESGKLLNIFNQSVNSTTVVTYLIWDWIIETQQIKTSKRFMIIIMI